MPKYKIGNKLYVIPREEVEKMLSTYPNAELVADDYTIPIVEENVEDVAVATEFPETQRVIDLNTNIDKAISPIDLTKEKKDIFKNEAVVEFDNFIFGDVEDFTTTRKDLEKDIKQSFTADDKYYKSASSYLFNNIIAEVATGLGGQLASANLLPDALTPDIIKEKPLMSGKDQATYDRIVGLRDVVARNNMNNPDASGADVEQYIIDNENSEFFINELRDLYTKEVILEKQADEFVQNIRDMGPKYDEEKGNYADSYGKMITGDEVQFGKPSEQKKIIEELKKNRLQLDEYLEENVFKLDSIENVLNINSKEIGELSNAQPTTQQEYDELVEKGKELFEQREIAATAWKKVADEQIDVFETDEKLNAYLNVIGRNQNLLDNAVIKAVVSATTMDQNITALTPYGITSIPWLKKMIDSTEGETKEIVQSYYNLVTGKAADKILSKYAEPEDFPEFSTLASVDGINDFGMWMANLIGTQATQVGVMLTTGPMALPILGASAAGASLMETQKEMDLGAKYTPLQRGTVALGTGVSEYLTEKVTFGILNKYRNSLIKDYARKGTGSVPEAIKEYTKKLFTKQGATMAAADFGVFGKDIFIEGSSEVAAGFFNRILQRDILGKDIGLFEGAREEFMSGAMMVGLVFRAPGVGLKVFKAFQPPGNQQQIEELQKQRGELNNQLSRAPGMNPTLKKATEEKIKQTEGKILEIYSNDLDIFSKMSNREKKQLMQIADKHDMLKTLHDKTIDDVELDKTPELKKQILDGINGDAFVLSEQKIQLLFNIKNRLYGKKGEKAVKEEIKTTTELGKKVGRKTVALSNDEWQKMFPDNQGEEARVGEKGIMYLNKDVMLAMAIENKGYIAAGTHELLHNILKGEFANPERGQKLAKDFLNILKTQNREAYDAVMKRIQDRGYTAKELKDNPDEYMTQFFSYLKETDVKYEQLDKGFIESLMDWFSKTLGIATELEADNIKFKNGRDLYNFILDYSADISKGKLSERSIELAKQGKNVTGKQSKSKAQSKVSIDVLANQYKNNPAEADAIDLVEQYNSIALAALGYKVGKGTVQPKEAISFVNSQFDSILRRWDGKQKLSTWIYANIQPKKQEFYESEIGDAAQTTSIDDERAQQIAAEETSTTEAKEEKTPTLIDPRILTNVKNKIKEIEREVKIKKEEVALSNFKYISDKFGAKVASIIYNIPEAKIKDATKNLTYAKKIINGIPENSEAGNIQNDFSQVDEVRRFLKILPPYNVSTSEATINKQGETIPVSKDVKGRSLGLSGIVQDYFYENYIDPKGEITNPKGRSKGSTTQPFVKILKPQFRDNISNETIKQLQKDLGITPTGQLNTYNRSPIGQFLKGIAKLKGAITANTIVDQQIDEMDIKTAKGKKQVKADTVAGRSVAQFSKADKKALQEMKPEFGEMYYDIKSLKVPDPDTGVDIPGYWVYTKETKDLIVPLFKDLDGFLNPTMLINNSTLGFPDSSKKMTPEQKLESEKIREYIKKDNPQLTKRNKLFAKTKFDSELLNTYSNKRIDEIIKRNTNMFKILWNTIDAKMAQLAKKGEDPGRFMVAVMQFMSMSQNEGTHLNRLGAKYTAKDITVNQWLFEHAVQNTRMYRGLLKASYDANFKNGIPFKKAIKKRMENYTLIAVAKDSAIKIDRASYIDKDGNKVYYKEGMGLNFNIMKDVYIARYANGDVGTFELTEPKQQYKDWKFFSKNWRVPGVPLENIKMHGTDISLAEFFEINNRGEKLTRSQVDQLKNLRKQSKIAAGKNATVFSKKVSKNQSVEQQVDVLENYDKAAKLSRALKTPEKGISVFDFDQTLADTKEKIKVTMPGESVVYNASPKAFDQLGKRTGLIFLATDIKEAQEYAKSNRGKVREISINDSSLATEDQVLDAMKNLNIDTSEGLLYEMIDSRFKDFYIGDANLNKLKKALKQRGFGGFKYNDGSQLSSKGTESVAIIDRSIIKQPTKINAAQFAEQAAELEQQGATFDFSEFTKVVDGKKGPMFDLAMKRQGKFGSKDIFVLTARPQQSAEAIKAFLDGIGLSIPLDNIIGLEDGTPMAKANWVAGKTAEGYNNFYFADDAIKNVKAVKEILDQVDVKSKVQQAKFSKAKRLNDEFNIIIEKKTGLGRNKQYSPARAKTIGASKGKFNFFIPNSAEDFVGLMYQLLGKGKEGDAQMAWLKKNLLDPFNRAEATITKDKISISNDFVELKKQFANIPKTLKKEALDGFTYEDALRVYIWNTQGKEIPGLAKKDVKELTEFINNNQDLKTFSNELIKILKGKEYPAPTDTWLGGNLTTDIIGGINTVNRAEYLQEWQENADIIFSPENMVKLEAAYGSSYVSALKNILKRMKTGTNKSNSGNKNVDDLMNWVNGSVGAIMFLNTRSAVLQTISAINFINWSDNNVLAAGKAFANQPQYWKDFMRLFNSDFLVSRRRGLKINVTESEIADAAEQGSVQGVISMLLKKGFVFTQIADSFAIAAGGSTFYRNRLNKLVKDGMSKDKAEEQAFLDFYAIAEESQQSSRTDRISAQQASAAGRLVLAFGNTPMQYARLIKKASMDLTNGRGDWKTNVSKIVYYGVVQNIIFNALQSALFTMLFDDDDEIPQDKVVRVANGMMDSLLRGLGIGGAVVSTIKNIILKVKQESQKKRPDYDSAALEILKLSPPISSKISKLRSAGRTFEWNAKEINEKGFSLDNPAYLAGAQILSATTNIPLDRVIKKGNNIADAISDESEYWQKVALLGGWALWELQPPKTKSSGSRIVVSEKSNSSKVKKKRIRKQKVPKKRKNN